ncbi:MAG: restriction endonuclease [Hyphomicrobiales bacterium]|nr:restriction endonuclease [Hyphomicrobiales bacterium]MDE2115221.1 restriction endonuclease [Hyphomicrobiales bacterium]
MTQSRTKGPEFVKYFAPVLNSLRALGNSGTPFEVREDIAKTMALSEAELNVTTSNGQSRFDNQVAWARFYLMKAGLIDGSERGVWRLTELGRATHLNHEQAIDLFKLQQNGLIRGGNATVSTLTAFSPIDSIQQAAPLIEDIAPDHREAMADILKKMTAKGFEHFSAFLLRKAGFTSVNVTGRANDGGIDGNGYLRINPMMTLRVLFQCKRYRDAPVSKDDIMKFQAAVIRERAEKGLFLTTSVFTRGAREEALGGACEIELIDIDRLIELMESMSLGLVEKKIFALDEDFFKEFLTA